MVCPLHYCRLGQPDPGWADPAFTRFSPSAVLIGTTHDRGNWSKCISPPTFSVSFYERIYASAKIPDVLGFLSFPSSSKESDQRRCAEENSRDISVPLVSDRCQSGMESYVIVSCRPWVFHAEVKTAEFPLENARINVSDVEKQFRLTFVILDKSKNSRVTLRPVDGNG